MGPGAFARTTAECGAGYRYQSLIPFSRIREIANFSLRRRANQWHKSAQPVPPRGTLAHSSRKRGAGCNGPLLASGDFFTRRNARQRTAKSCGPGAATLASIPPPCGGVATVARKAVHRGEREVSRQTIARGRPGCLAVLVVLPVCFGTRDARVLRHTGSTGASSTRPSLRPLFPERATRLHHSGEFESRERAVLSPRHCEERSDDPSTLAAQATPGWESAELGERRRKQSSFLVVAKKAGLLRFARNDGFDGVATITLFGAAQK